MSKEKKDVLSMEIQKNIMAKRKQISLSKDDIIANPLNDFAIEDLPELKNSILLNGLLEPLGVMGPLEDGKYKLLSGERRWRSINELIAEKKMEEFPIPVYVIDDKDLDDITQKIIIKTSNLETRQKIDQNRHRAEIMELLKMQVDNGDITRKEMAIRAAKFFKTSDRYGRYWRMVFEHDDDELKDMVRDDAIDIKSASYIANIEDSEKRSELKEKIKNGEDSRSVIKEDIKKKKKSLHTTELQDVEESKERKENPYPLDLNVEQNELPTELPKESRVPSTVSEENTVSDEDPDNSDFLASRSLKNGKFRLTQEEMQNLSVDDLDPSFFDLDDDIDLNLDGIEVHESERISTLMNEDPEKDEERYLTKLNAIMQWCRKMKEVDVPSDAEWDVILACKEVVDRFM